MEPEREPSSDRGAHDGRSTTVWLVEDNDMYRRTIAALIDGEDDLSCPVCVASCEEALRVLRKGLVPDVVLMDIGLPGMSGIEGTRRIRTLSPVTRVVMLTVHDERDAVFEAITAGASGYLLKSSEADGLMEAIRQVREGGAPINAFIARKILEMFAGGGFPETDYGLTERETEILELMVEELTMQEIAERLHISYHTVDTHIRNIYQKLHVRSRSSAVAKALKERLV